MNAKEKLTKELHKAISQFAPAPPAFVSDEEEEYQMRIMREAARAIGSPLDGSSFAERQYATRKALLDKIDNAPPAHSGTDALIGWFYELQDLAARVRKGE